MKTKIISLIIIAFVVGMFSSCEGPMGPEGPQGPPGMNDWTYLNKTVKSSQWKWDDELGVFYFTLEDNAINSNFVEEGMLQVAVLHEGTYFPLSLTEHFWDGDFLTETIRYTYGVGWIRFIIGADDLFEAAGPDYKPGDYTFKVTMVW